MLKTIDDLVNERAVVCMKLSTGVSGAERVETLEKNTILKHLEGYAKDMSKNTSLELINEYDKQMDALPHEIFDDMQQELNSLKSAIDESLRNITVRANSAVNTYNTTRMKLAILGAIIEERSIRENTLEDELTAVKRELINYRAVTTAEIKKKDAEIADKDAEIAKLGGELDKFVSDRINALRDEKLAKDALAVEKLKILAEITKEKKEIKAQIASEREKDRELKRAALEQKRIEQAANMAKKKAKEDAAKEAEAIEKAKEKPDEDYIALMIHQFGIREAKRQMRTEGYDVSDL